MSSNKRKEVPPAGGRAFLCRLKAAVPSAQTFYGDEISDIALPRDVDLLDPELTILLDRVQGELTDEEREFLKDLIRGYLERRRRRES